MKIKSIIEVDNGVKYCALRDIEHVFYEIKNDEKIIHIEVACAVNDDYTSWSLHNVLQRKNDCPIVSKNILVNPIHIVSIRPTNIDLNDD